RADVGDVLVGAAPRHPEERARAAGALVLDLEVAAARAGDLDDERQRLLEERLDLALVPQLEEAAIQIALAPQPLRLVVGHHGSIGDERAGREGAHTCTSRRVGGPSASSSTGAGACAGNAGSGASAVSRSEASSLGLSSAVRMASSLRGADAGRGAKGES